MGGSKPSAPTVIMPAETQPQQFQSVIPEKSFKDLAQQMGRIEKETGKIQDQRYDEVGPHAEIGAKQRAIETQEAASYKASLPRGGSPDERFKETPRPFPIKSNRRATFDTVPGSMTGFGGSRPNTGPSPTRGGGGRRAVGQVGPPPGRSGFFPFPRKPSNPAKEAASMRYNQAKSNYFDALNKAKTKKPTFMPETVNPGFAQNPDDLYLPKVINAPEE